jgi:uroporphyrinogen decarboxylase
MPMTSRERILATIQHEKPDRVPIVIGASNATGIKMRPYQRLKNLLGIQAADHYLYNWPELGTANPDEETLQRLHSDVRGVHDRFPAQVYSKNQQRPAHAPFYDDWGSGSMEIEPGVWFPAIHPLSEAQAIDELERYAWPDMNDPTRIAYVRQYAQRLADENQYAIMATPWLLFPFERAFALQGMDHFLLNMALNPEFAQALLLKIAGLCKTLMGNFLDQLGENVDIIKIGDDLGTQESLLISPKMYRRVLKPIHADYIAFIKERTRAKVFFHTDGDVFDLVEDFIEIGVDILNPIQTSAGKMSHLADLKKRYGRQILFCGAIDTHRLLPFGSPIQVRQEVRRVIEAMANGGGYLLAAVHTIMDEVPPENILAMVDAALEFGN